jgi:hypothetical protein
MMAAGLSMIGGLVQGIGAMKQYQAQAQADRYNAAVAVRNKQIISEQTAAQTADQLEANRRQISSIRALFLTNGMSQTGSMMDAMRDQIRTNALGIERINYAGQLKEIEQTDKYNLAEMSASDADSAAGISLVSGILGGVSGAVNTLSRAS